MVVEATGSTSVGANMASATIASGNHLVMVNVETDVTIGALLKRKADSAGVVYSLVDGDQPGVTMNIIEWAWSLGLEVVAGGPRYRALCRRSPRHARQYRRTLRL